MRTLVTTRVAGDAAGHVDAVRQCVAEGHEALAVLAAFSKGVERALGFLDLDLGRGIQEDLEGGRPAR